MRTLRSLSTFLAFLCASLLLSGCGSSLPPRPLTAAQKAVVAQTPRLGVVAVTVPEPYPGHGNTLRSMLEKTGLFESAVLAGPATPSPVYTAKIDDRCSCRHGGWIPIFPILTLGIVPQFTRCTMGYAFTLREEATGQETKISCNIKETIAVGWLPALLNVLPRWTLDDSETSESYKNRLAYSIVSQLSAAERPEPKGTAPQAGKR